MIENAAEALAGFVIKSRMKEATLHRGTKHVYHAREGPIILVSR